MKRFLGNTVVLAAVAALSLLPARAGYSHHVSVGYHGHHYGSHHSSYAFGYYGGPYYGGYYSPYSWRYAGNYEMAQAWQVARYRSGAGAVEVDIRPRKAQVILNGTPVGQARDFNGPRDLLILGQGAHTLEFSAPGYMTLRVALKVKAGGYVRFTDRLVEGEGLDPRSTESVHLQAVEPVPGDEPSMKEPLQSEEPTVRLQGGLLRVRVQPLDAAVYLDGDFLAKGSELSRLHGSIPVARGMHILEVVRPGYQAQRITVLVEGDQPTRVQVELQPND